MVDLAKFGKFRADDAIGKPLGIPYEIYDRDRLRVVPEEDIFDDYGLSLLDGMSIELKQLIIGRNEQTLKRTRTITGKSTTMGIRRL
jgi:hypothetical protein